MSNTGRRAIWIVVLPLVLGVGVGSAETRLLDRLITVVDDDVILESQYLSALELARESAVTSVDADSPEFRQSVLDQLILQSLQLQFGERVGLRISDEEVNARLTKIAESSDMSFNDFVEDATSQGIYHDVRRQVHDQMIIENVQRGMMSRTIQISPQEIRDFLYSPEGVELLGSEYLVSHLRLPFEGDKFEGDKDAMLERASAIVEQVRTGIALGDAARRVGLQENLQEIDWRKMNQMPSLFVDTLNSLKQNEVSDPLSSRTAFHVIQLLERRGPGEKAEKQTQARHILLEPNEIRDIEEAQKLAQELYDRIGKGESFADLARAYSDDPGSALEGGDLGWISEGVMVQEFHEAMDTAEVGGLIKPFETQYGWHIALVVARRIQDVSIREREQMAANEMFRRRYPQVLGNWLKQIRRDAFVEQVVPIEEFFQPES